MSDSARLARRARRLAARALGRRGPAGGRNEPLAPPEPLDPMAMFHWCRQSGKSVRPHYLWCVLLAARNARALRVDRVAALEFGVAGGNGLLELERAAAVARDLTGVTVEVYGFDTGIGMPEPIDHRDLPWTIEEGYFAMDEAALRRRLTVAQLVLGPVEHTAPSWAAGDHPPVAFAAFDLDYYSSTVHALRIFDGGADTLLPRVACYFDDIFGWGWSDFTGPRAAIADFNDAHPHRKVAKIHGLRYELPPPDHLAAWPDKLYLAHLFDHPRYNESEGGLSRVWADHLHLAPPAAS